MATNPKDIYYQRGEVSNSDLTALKYKLYPSLNFMKEKDRQKAFHLGTLVDAYVTEPKKMNHYRLTVDDEPYTKEEWAWGKLMRDALYKRAKSDAFLDYVLKKADGQAWFRNPSQRFEYGCFEFELPTRCKWDWWLGAAGFGGDLKTVSVTSDSEFENSIDFFDWDRSRAWYMDLVHSLNPAWGNRDFIYAISKKNQKVFFKKIERGDELYERGKEKYLQLAFHLWCLI